MTDDDKRINNLEAAVSELRERTIALIGRADGHEQRISGHKLELINTISNINGDHKEILRKLDEVIKWQILAGANMNKMVEDIDRSNDKASSIKKDIIIIEKEMTNLRSLKNKLIGASFFFPIVWGSILYGLTKMGVFK